MARYLCIIPARGGSKGIPGKNLKPLGGRPLIVWSIEQALAAAHIDRVVVSTDSEEIAAVARRAGAEVPFMRPPELATDAAMTESALIHAIGRLAEDGYRPDAVLLLQATSPMRRPGRIDAAIAQFEAEQLDSMVSAVPTHRFYWRRADAVEAMYDYPNRPRRQDYTLQQRFWQENGSIYITRTELLLGEENRLGGRIGLFEMSEDEAVEIDTELDFAKIETILRYRPELAAGRRLQRQQVDVIILDFDGVLTDNRVLVRQDAVEAVSCNRSDGLAIGELRRAGVPVVIISTEANPVVSARAEKLNLPVIQSVSDKAEAVRSYCEAGGHALERAVFVGNDLNDLAAMRTVGWPVAVADSQRDVRAAAWYVLNTPGGAGIMRELLEEVLAPGFTGGAPVP